MFYPEYRDGVGARLFDIEFRRQSEIFEPWSALYRALKQFRA